MINVAIVESDLELNGILFSRLKSADINPVGQFYSAREFTNELPRLKSQIVLVDIKLPRTDLIAFISSIKKQKPEIKIIVTSAWVQNDLIYKAICAGASGYLNKFSDKNLFIKSILEIVNDQPQLSLPIAQLIQDNFLGNTSSAFTLIEQQIIKLLAAGLRGPNVAPIINQSPEAVLQQIGNIYRKIHNFKTL